MPEPKIRPKVTLPKEKKEKAKAKRKLVEEDADATSLDKNGASKPAKKLRKDDSPNVPRTNTTRRKRSEPDVVKHVEMEEVEMSEKVTESQGKRRQKSNMENKQKRAQLNGGGVQKVVGKQHQIVQAEADAGPDGGYESGNGGSVSKQAEEEEIHLQGFSSESDSSDEELDSIDAPPLDVSKLPSFANDDAAVQRKLEKAKKNPTEDKGVIYLGRIPHGFYEDQMRNYFSQFGDVTRLRLSRNKKTGKSKHYAFIEFSSSTVATIVCETMNNYLLLGHILQCKLIPKDQVHPELWIGANKKWRFVPRDRIARVKQNKSRTQEERDRAEAKLIARQKKKQAKILASGIQYDFADVAYKPEVLEGIS